MTTRNFSLLFAMLVLCACAAPTPLPTATPVPTATPPPTVTPAPLPTATPSAVPTETSSGSGGISVDTAARLAEAAQVGGLPARVVWLDGGQSFATVESPAVTIYSASDLTVIKTVDASYAGRVLDFSPDGRTLLGQASDGLVQLWDADTGQKLYDLVPSLNAFFVAGGSQVAASANAEPSFSLWDVTSGGQVKTLTGFNIGASPVYGGEFSPGGQYMMWIARARVQLMDNDTGQLFPEQTYQEFVIDVTFSADERQVAVVVPSQGGGLIDLFTTDGQKTASLSNPAMVVSTSFTPDGAILAAGLLDGTIVFWDVAAQQTLATVPGHAGQVYLVSISPDGSALVSAGEDSTVRLWRPTP